MKARYLLSFLVINLFFALPLLAEDEEVDSDAQAGKAMEPPPITLYQVGQNGRYCVSLTKEPSGCISGVDDKGDEINVMDVLKGGKIIFKNISDAAHDMRITGANGEDLPAQAANGADVEKGMLQVDLSKQKITCSFHGAQLGLGYRVPEMQAFANGHNTPLGSTPQFAAADSDSKPIAKTGLADVANFIMNGLFPDQKKKLMQGRPDIVAAYPEIAAELGMKGGKILVGSNGAVAGFVQPNNAPANAKPGDGKISIANVSPKVATKGNGAAGADFATPTALPSSGEGTSLFGFKKEDKADGGEFNSMLLRSAHDADTYIEFTDAFNSDRNQFKLGKDKNEKSSRELASKPLLGASGTGWGLHDTNWIWWMLAALSIAVFEVNEHKDKIKKSRVFALIKGNKQEKDEK